MVIAFGEQQQEVIQVMKNTTNTIKIQPLTFYKNITLNTSTLSTQKTLQMIEGIRKPGQWAVYEFVEIIA